MSEQTAVKKDPKQKKGFFKQLKAEFKKIVWPDRKTLGRQTVAVIVIAAIMCVLITLVDTGALAVVQALIK